MGPNAARLSSSSAKDVGGARLRALDSGDGATPLALPIAIDRPACGKCLRALRAVNIANRRNFTFAIGGSSGLSWPGWRIPAFMTRDPQIAGNLLPRTCATHAGRIAALASFSRAQLDWPAAREAPCRTDLLFARRAEASV